MQASEREVIWVMRFGILGVGALATVMGITITTIYGLWYLCADLVFVILFPQLVSVVYLRDTNTYGSLSGYLGGLLFRLLGGEPLIGLPSVIKYPGYNYVLDIQTFPFKTVCMLFSFSLILIASYTSKYIFENGHLPKNYDIFMCVVNIPDEVIALKEHSANGEEGEMTVLNTKKAESNGQINPALKFSKDDLLDPGQGRENKGLEVSPVVEEPPPRPPEYNNTGL